MTELPLRAPYDPLPVRRRRERVRTVASTGVAIVGVVSLLAAVSPPFRHRLHVVLEVLPSVVPPTAATTLVLVSVGLLLMARGLRHGQRLAWWGTLVLLVASVLLHLARGLGVEAAVITTSGATWLATQRTSFGVLPSRATVRRALVLGTIGGVFAVVLAVTLTEAVEPPRFHRFDRMVLPLAIVAGAALVAAAAWILLSPKDPRRLTAEQHREERERARAVVKRYGAGTLDWFALRDDKDWFFTGRSVVAHAVHGGVCLVSPDPIGPDDEQVAVWSEFLAYVEQHGWSVAVLGARPERLPLYEASGLRPVYLGDEAIVDCREFALAGAKNKSLRQAVGRVRREGYTTTFHDPASLDPALRAQLEDLRGQSRRGGRERGFSMTLSRLFDPQDIDFLLAVTRNRAGRVDAFAQWVPAPGIDGWSLDVMRRRISGDVPNGVIEACIVATIEEVAARGDLALSLNFAPMRSVLESTEVGGPLVVLTRPLLAQMSERTQMASLAMFNRKFHPRWEPRYVVLDSVEWVASQSLVMADVEGVTELPVIGRFLGRSSAPGGR
ncbi:bifunctional lysylphosphatidylglycerol flippase/synthetase MprF [Xylanimonas sp. McL0601]|uniref:bifunctional lysylphosphatidylglycerol flippase/synthetase MprF n=1 Tax=Xylanimonas sp. McL0601 TaxID=3414739 RepID=UPI003CF04FCC